MVAMVVIVSQFEAGSKSPTVLNHNDNCYNDDNHCNHSTVRKQMAAIDTGRLKQSVDLLALIGRDVRLRRVASTHSGEWAGPCPFCGGRDRLHVQPHATGEGRWFCRQCTGAGQWQDAIDYVRRRDGLNFAAACERLGADLRVQPTAESARPAPAVDPGPPGADWQRAARRIIEDCEQALWHANETKARVWLNARGLSKETLRGWHIGYCPKAGQYHGLYLDRGILIPWVAAGAIWKLNIRRPAGHPKYRAVKGSHSVSALFGVDKLIGRPDCIITEGEFDALLVWQEMSELADVLTLGSESGRVADRWLPTLLRYRHFWIATDNDKAGEQAAAYWLSLTGERGQRLLPPGTAKDITEAWQKGADLQAWAREMPMIHK